MIYQGWLIFLMVLLTCLILIQIVVKIILYERVIDVLTKVEILLRINETHAQVTDSQRERTVEAIEGIKTQAKTAATTAVASIKEAAEDVKSAVTTIPDKVIERLNEGPLSGDKLPTIKDKPHDE